MIHLGDLLDRRKYVNWQTAHRLRKDFIEPLQYMGVETHLVLGNHDVFWRDTNSVAGPTELLGGFENFHVYSEPTTQVVGDTPFLLLPWINPENYQASMDAIRTSPAMLCAGHLELEGFEMDRGDLCKEGMSPEFFNRFDEVYSGHFHHKSRNGNVNYLGSHMEFTWADWDDERGFHVLDTETRGLGFIPNPYTLHEKVFYDNGPTNKEFSVKDKYVKVVVKEKDDPILFERFIDQLEGGNPIDVQVVDDHRNANQVLERIEVVDESDDTLSIFKRSIEESHLNPEQRVEASKFISELYQESLNDE